MIPNNEGSPEWVRSERESKKYKTNLGTLKAWKTIYEVTPVEVEKGVYSTEEFHARCRQRSNCTLATNGGKRSMGRFRLVPDSTRLKKFSTWTLVPTKCDCEMQNRVRKSYGKHAAEVEHLIAQGNHALDYKAKLFDTVVTMTTEKMSDAARKAGMGLDRKYYKRMHKIAAIGNYY